MALGYARATGRPGVFSVVPGPGILNASAALLTALGVNAPVMAITGQVPSAYFGRGRGHLHEMRDQLATMQGFRAFALLPRAASRVWPCAEADVMKWTVACHPSCPATPRPRSSGAEPSSGALSVRCGGPVARTLPGSWPRRSETIRVQVLLPISGPPHALPQAPHSAAQRASHGTAAQA